MAQPTLEQKKQEEYFNSVSDIGPSLSLNATVRLDTLN